MKKSVWLVVLVMAIFLGLNFKAVASAKYTQENGKKCAFCHTSVPKKGATDPLLNQDGKTFKDNDNKLTDEQKARK